MVKDEVTASAQPLKEEVVDEEGHVEPSVRLTSEDGGRRCAAVRERPRRAAGIAALVAIIAVVVLATRNYAPLPPAGNGNAGQPSQDSALPHHQDAAAQELSSAGSKRLRSSVCGEVAMSQDTAKWNALKCDCLALTDPAEATQCYVSKAMALEGPAYRRLDAGAGVGGAGGRGAAMAHTETILSFGARSPGDPGWHQTYDYIWGTLEALGWHMEADAFTQQLPPAVASSLGTSSKPMKNIIASFNPEGGDCAVDLAAHFDSKFVRDYVFLGATDSAAPIGMMLAAAQALTPALRAKLAADSHTPCFRMVFFDGEEAFVRWSDGPDGDSIYGSRHLAAKWAADADPFVDGASPPRRRIQSMRAMALLDLLGAARPELTWHFSSTRNLFEHMQATEARARSAGLIKGAGGAHSPHYLASNGNRSPISDDHLPWLERGVPILHLIASPFPSVWHTQADNLAALDHHTVEDLALVLRAAVAELYGLAI